MRFITTVLVGLLAVPAGARAQTLVPPPTPESHLIEAKRLLGNVAASPTTDVGKQIAALQVDFTEFTTAYLSNTGVDWHGKSAVVDRDLNALLGAGSEPSASAASASLDPSVRRQLQAVRDNLQLFYAAVNGQPPATPAPAAPPSAASNIDVGTASALLDRMQALLDGLTGESGKPVGTSGSLGKSRKVEVDRQSLDELRAEIAQLRTMIVQN
ncbi:MAG TPA: hypothetical protein VEU08_07280 [Vicinamibacterales bacterium]|nr:hypothetical protein [Vicinamibacterales bacterium]